MARLSFGQRFRNPKEQEYVGFFLAPEDKTRLRKLAHFADQKISEYLRSLISNAWTEHKTNSVGIIKQLNPAEVTTVDSKTAEFLNKFFDLEYSDLEPSTDQPLQEDEPRNGV